MPRTLLDIPGKDRQQRIWIAQFENGGYVPMLTNPANAILPATNLARGQSADADYADTAYLCAAMHSGAVRDPPMLWAALPHMSSMCQSDMSQVKESRWHCVKLLLIAGECVSEVERSLIYCKAHKIPDGCNNPEHDRPVFRKALLQRWKVHFAHLFPQLTSSQKVLAQV